MTPSLLRLAEAKDYPADRLIALDVKIDIGQGPFVGPNLIEMGIGAEIPQGSFFAYLFRRFGYPNIGSDNYKDLATYILTTTHPNMLLQITPYAGGDTDISIRFMVPYDVNRTVGAWETRSRDAHQKAFFDWVMENEGKPEFADDLVQQMKNSGWPMPDKPNQHELEQVFFALTHLEYMVKRNENPPNGTALEAMNHEQRRAFDENQRRAKAYVDWAQTQKNTYHALHPQPDFDYRDADWTQWSDNDPLKSYAQAIMSTLADLKRPVYVRDCAISPWGFEPEHMDQDPDDDEEDTDETETSDVTKQDINTTEDCASAFSIKNSHLLPSTEYANAAGYPSGHLGNIDPVLFSDIHNAINQLGGGNATEGMQKALMLLKEATQAQTKPQPKP